MHPAIVKASRAISEKSRSLASQNEGREDMLGDEKLPKAALLRSRSTSSLSALKTWSVTACKC
jgi:hypothetical protein